MTEPRHHRTLFMVGVLSSVVVVEPAPVDLLLVGLSAIWMVRDRMRLPALAVALGSTYVSLSVFSQLIGNANDYAIDGRIIRDLAIEGYLVLTLITLMVKFAQDRNAMRSFFTGVTIGAVVVSTTFLLLEVVGQAPDLFYRDEFRSRVRGLFKDPNVLGPFLVMPILLLLVRNELVKLPMARLAATPCVLVLVLTYSRGAYVAFACSLVFLAAIILIREQITYAGAATAAGGLAVLFIAGWALWGVAGAPEIGFNTDRLALQSYDAGRFSLNYSARDWILQYPFGNGVQAFAREIGVNPHNLFLGKAVDAGILGGLIVVAVPIVAIARALVAKTDIPRFGAITAAALTGNMAVSMVIHSHHWRHLFFTVAAALAIGAHHKLSHLRDVEIDLVYSESLDGAIRQPGERRTGARAGSTAIHGGMP